MIHIKRLSPIVLKTTCVVFFYLNGILLRLYTPYVILSCPQLGKASKNSRSVFYTITTIVTFRNTFQHYSLLVYNHSNLPFALSFHQEMKDINCCIFLLIKRFEQSNQF